MSLSWIARLFWVGMQVLFSGLNPLTCARVYDTPPSSALPRGKTYEEWYGSPELMCATGPQQRHWRVFCIGNNC